LGVTSCNVALERDASRTTVLFGSDRAKIRMGDLKDGEGDQAAARVLSPEIDKQFAFYGLN
jgi:hypothetical protein